MTTTAPFAAFSLHVTEDHIEKFVTYALAENGIITFDGIESQEDLLYLCTRFRTIINHADHGQPEQAHKLYIEALATLRQINDQRGMAMVLGKLGVLAREQSQPEQARQFYEEALTIARRMGDQSNMGVLLINLGNLTRQQGQPERARQLYEEALEINRCTENRRLFAFTLLNLGSLASDQGQFEQARQSFHEAIQIFRELQDRRDLALTLQSLGSQEVVEGLLELAHTHLDEALTLFRAIGDKRLAGLTMRDMGGLARLEGHPNEARTLLEEALSLFTEALDVMRQMRDRRNAAHTLLELGRLTWQVQQIEETLSCLLGAGVGMKLMRWFEISDVENMLAQVYTRLGEAAFVVLAERVAYAKPEPAYQLMQPDWADLIQQFIATTVETCC